MAIGPQSGLSLRESPYGTALREIAVTYRNNAVISANSPGLTNISLTGSFSLFLRCRRGAGSAAGESDPGLGGRAEGVRTGPDPAAETGPGGATRGRGRGTSPGA